MRTVLIPILATLAVLPMMALAAQGYSGQQDREIKALSAEEIADLTAGRGMGLAKAAELNHYPGPAHVLELKDRLGLTVEQVQVVEASFQRMSAAAKPLGAEIVQREQALDRSFIDHSVTPDSLSIATAELGAIQGKLRAIHLAAHLEMRGILTADQVARYDELRGYTGAAVAPMGHHQHGG